MDPSVISFKLESGTDYFAIKYKSQQQPIIDCKSGVPDDQIDSECSLNKPYPHALPTRMEVFASSRVTEYTVVMPKDASRSFSRRGV